MISVREKRMVKINKVYAIRRHIFEYFKVVAQNKLVDAVHLLVASKFQRAFSTIFCKYMKNMFTKKYLTKKLKSAIFAEK